MIQQWIREATKVATVQLASPSNRNALSLHMLQTLHETIRNLASSSASSEKSNDVRAIIVQHEGPAFSSGHDLKELKHMMTTQDRDAIRELFITCSALMKYIAHECPVPVIAKVNGIASAAGCQLVASCDLAYATESSQFVTPGVNIGLFCSTPAVALSRAVGRKAAAEMLLTGRPIRAQKACEIGLINEVFPTVSSLDDHVETIAALIARNSPTSIRLGKPTFVRQLSLDLDAAYDMAGATMCANALEEECAEGISAFLEKRPPAW